jgi:hypothetical protein
VNAGLAEGGDLSLGRAHSTRDDGSGMVEGHSDAGCRATGSGILPR